jgi:hypothetical protein
MIECDQSSIYLHQDLSRATPVDSSVSTSSSHADASESTFPAKHTLDTPATGGSSHLTLRSAARTSPADYPKR